MKFLDTIFSFMAMTMDWLLNKWMRYRQVKRVYSMHNHNTKFASNFLPKILWNIPTNEEELHKLERFSYSLFEKVIRKSESNTVEIKEVEIRAIEDRYGDIYIQSLLPDGGFIRQYKLMVVNPESEAENRILNLQFVEGEKAQGFLGSFMDFYLGIGIDEDKARELTMIMFLNIVRRVYSNYRRELMDGKYSEVENLIKIAHEED